MPHPRSVATRLKAIIVREYHIPEASILFMVAFVASAALGVVRQILFNAQFGAESEASAFYAAFRLPDTLTSIIAGGTLVGALIPVLAGVAREEDQAAEWRAACLVMTVFGALLTLVVTLGIIFAPIFVRSVLAPGFDGPTSELTITLTRIMLLQAVLSVVANVIIAMLNGRNQFTLTALAIVVHNVAMISGILAARIIPGLGIFGPTLGVVADALLQLAVLWVGLRANNLRIRLIWNLADRRLREVTYLLIPSGLSSGVNYAGTIVDTAYGSLAREAATLPAIQNAYLLIGLPFRLLGNAIGQAMFPHIAQYAAAHEWRKLNRTMLVALGVALGLTLPVMVAFTWLGRDLVRFLFERGRFSADAGSLTYAILLAYTFGLPAYIATDLIARGLTALRDTLTPLLTNCGQLAGRIWLITLLLDQQGAVAIPLAFAISSAVETLVLGAVLTYKLRLKAKGESARV
jgi:putative peptidoglycan lipid II flippase